MVADHEFVDGLYISELENTVKVWPTTLNPPATNTVPSFSNVAVGVLRGTDIGASGFHMHEDVGVDGSVNISTALVVPVVVSPPATITLPS